MEDIQLLTTTLLIVLGRISNPLPQETTARTTETVKHKTYIGRIRSLDRATSTSSGTESQVSRDRLGIVMLSGLAQMQN